MNKAHWKALEYMRDGMFIAPELTEKLIRGIRKKSRVSVAHSFEMMHTLHEKGFKDVTLVVEERPMKYIRNICSKYGYDVKTFEEIENMKFDVVLTNPPYQSGNVGEERNVGAPNWPVFVDLCMNYLVEGGEGCFVTPATWMNRSKQGAWKYIQDYDLSFVNPNVKEHFPNVGGNGGTFCFFKLKKRPYSGKTELSTGKTINFHEDAIPKNNKHMDEIGFKLVQTLMPMVKELDVKSGPINPSINSDHWSSTETPTHQYETYYSGKSDRRSIWCDAAVGDYGKWKLVVPSSGNFYETMEITKKGVGRQGNYVLGKKSDLVALRDLLLTDKSRQLSEVMMEGNFNNALEYVVEQN